MFSLFKCFVSGSSSAMTRKFGIFNAMSIFKNGVKLGVCEFVIVVSIFLFFVICCKIL